VEEEAARKKAEEEAVRKKVEEEARKKTEDQFRKKLLEEAVELARKELEEEGKRKKALEEERQQLEIAKKEEVQVAKQRVLCYVPFLIYFMRPCKKITKKKPLFNPQAIIDSMLE